MIILTKALCVCVCVCVCVCMFSKIQKNLHAYLINVYHLRLKIWNGTSMDSIWKGSLYQSNPATPIKSLSKSGMV